MPMIDCKELAKTYGDKTILRDATLVVRSRERVGLVGNNGSGKSTLGRILAGVEKPDAGSIARRRGARFDYLAQEPSLPPGHTVSELVLASLSDWSRAKQRYDALTARLGQAPDDLEQLVAEQAAAGEEVERCGGWERLHEAEAIIGHLGIQDSARPVEVLSGGERRRVALARILVGKPDLAILDEPTNHLDVATIEWLEEYLRDRFTGALLLITHDRYVLDRVTSRTLELEGGRITSYDGGYAAYLEARAQRQAQAERVERNRQNFLRRELDWLRRQPKARGTKQKARIGRVQAALDQTGPGRAREADLRLESERQGKAVLSLSGLRLEREGQLLIEGLDLDLARGERIGVVGPNGTGKTSLLLCLLGELETSGGSTTLGERTRIGYLDQARADLDDQLTVREYVTGEQGTIELGDQSLEAGAYLERFLFDRGAQRLRVGVLSGGERARVCLARLLCQRTNLLLLDEPTNDLDVATLAALEAMLVDYAGSALIVSHDRWFLDRVATSILAFEGEGKVELHRGNYSEYREKQASESRARGAASPAPSKRAANAAKVRDKGRRTQLSFAEERELDGLLDRIEAAEAEVELLESKLADPATYAGDGSIIASLKAELARAQETASELTVRWEALEAKKAELAADACGE